MGRLLVMNITEEQELAIIDLFTAKKWTFNNLAKFISKTIENEILSVWKESLEEFTDASSSIDTSDLKAPAIAKKESQPIHASSSEINLNKETVENDKIVTRKKRSKPQINHSKPLNLRSKNCSRSLNTDTGSQQTLFTSNVDLEQTESRLHPENENDNDKKKDADVLNAKFDNVTEEKECFNKGNDSCGHDISLENSELIACKNDKYSAPDSEKTKPKIKLKGQVKKDFKCEECNYRTNVRSNLNRHLKEIHSGVRYTCSKCTKTFKGKHDAKMHQLYSHSSGFQCKQCDKSFSSISGLRNHVKIIHKKRCLYECEHCDMKFYYKSHYLGHRNKHLNLKPFSCKICQKPFRYKIACHLHEKTCCHDNYYITHNSDGSSKEANKSKFLCDICGKEVSSRSSLKAHHYYTHSDDTKTVCSLCGKSFKGQYSLQRHIKNAHEDTGVRYTCPDCKKEFSQQQIFKQHLKIHQKAYTCTCETCGKGFLSKFKMLEHTRIHTGEKPFTCPHCHTFKSATKTNLQKHMRIHEEGRSPRQQSKKKNVKPKSTLVSKGKAKFHEVKSDNDAKSDDTGIKHFQTLVEPVYISLEMPTGSYVGSSQFIEGEGHYTNLQKMSMDDKSAKYDCQSYRHVYIGEEDKPGQGQGQINCTVRNRQGSDAHIHSRFDARNIQDSEFNNAHSSEIKNEVKVDGQTEYELNANSDGYYGGNSTDSTELSQGLNILTVAMNIVNPNQY